MSAANLAAINKQQASEAFLSIRAVADSKVLDKEIDEAIQKAYREAGTGTYTPYTRPQTARPVIADGKAARQKIIDKGRFSTEAELTANSPIAIPDDYTEQQRLFLETMFDGGDFVFSGDRLQPGTDRTILPVCEWIEQGAAGPFCVINPLSGYPAPLKSGTGATYRGDSCVSKYRHCLLEFDDLSIENQIKFWSAIPLPIQAITHTGNKSLHIWLDLAGEEINSLEAWHQTVEIDLYDKRFVPLGVDRSCKNAARLARLPGVLRAETGKWQRLLWLSNGGRHVVS
jgi:hypothetical protein